jgi:hypothetical protein
MPAWLGVMGQRTTRWVWMHCSRVARSGCRDGVGRHFRSWHIADLAAGADNVRL